MYIFINECVCVCTHVTVSIFFFFSVSVVAISSKIWPERMHWHREGNPD